MELRLWQHIASDPRQDLMVNFYNPAKLLVWRHEKMILDVDCTEADILACPSLRWIGVHYQDLERYHIPSCLLIELSKNDKRKIKNMILREVA